MVALSIRLFTLLCLSFYFQRSFCDTNPNYREIFLSKLYRDTYLNPPSLLAKEACTPVSFRELFLSQQYQRTFVGHAKGSKVSDADDCNDRCQNGGNCIGGVCQCTSGYTGQFCEFGKNSTSGTSFLVFILETSNKNTPVFDKMKHLIYDVWQRLTNNMSLSYNGRLVELRKFVIGKVERNITSSSEMNVALSKFTNFENMSMIANITSAFMDSDNYLMGIPGGASIPGAAVLLSDGIPHDPNGARRAAKLFKDDNFALFVVLCNGSNTEAQTNAQEWATSPFDVFAFDNRSVDTLAMNLSGKLAFYFATFNRTLSTTVMTTEGNVSFASTVPFTSTNTSATLLSTTTFGTIPSTTRSTLPSTTTTTVSTSTTPTTTTTSVEDITTASTSVTSVAPTSAPASSTDTTNGATTMTRNSTSSTTKNFFNDNPDLITGLSKFAIVGIVLGCISSVAIFMFILCYCRYRARNHRRMEKILRSNNSSIQQPKNSIHSYVRSTKPREILNPNYFDVWYLEPNRLIIHKDQVLGSGAFSTVYRGRIVGKAPLSNIYPSILASNQFIDCEVAVKIPPIYADQMAISDFRQEMNLMKAFGYHNHLVSLLGSSTTHDGNPCIITELCSGGNLLYYVRNRKQDILKAHSQSYQNTLRFRDLLSFAWQICDGMDFLGSKGCIHRDLAARNILVNDEKIAKIGDFGLCRLMNSAIYNARGGRLPIKWMAIESLQLYEYSFKSDVWSFGVLLYELFSLGAQPYTTVQPADMIDYLVAGRRLEKPDSCPDDIYQIMTSTWVAEPEKRPTFDELRRTFAEILENATQDYGYLHMSNETLKVYNEMSTEENND